ncbi:hypothetical protein GJ744_007863 [Endocarpon pusillum]|uniref:Uncharacterized protein n=1 Tax=Endocarpon pusillum TaxID=364733 RepID=A0A8H7AT25_9EURO|nr:hypothetical protein GJ744_007863 [Endocarpon pusillum]
MVLMMYQVQQSNNVSKADGFLADRHIQVTMVNIVSYYTGTVSHVVKSKTSSNLHSTRQATPFRVCSWNRKHESSAYVLIRSQIHPNGSDRFLAIYLPHGLRPSSENLFAYLFRLPTPPVVTDVVDQIVDLNAVKMILSLPTTDLSSTAHLMKAPPTFLTRSHRDRGLDVFPHKHLLPSRVVLAASVSSSCSNPQQPRKLKTNRVGFIKTMKPV